jgi:multiple sugar transport system ATP-binding protein
VASFIGSPAMNFIPGEVRSGSFEFVERGSGNGEAGRGQIEVGGTVPEGPAVLGVRPEDLLAREDGSRLGTVTLDVVEHMGHETIAHFALAGGDHMARLAADSGVQPGDRLPLSIRPGAYHLFSGDDGRRLN